MAALDWLNVVVAAVLLAGIYAVMSVGMTIIYGVMKIVNLAHAGFMMLGAYFAYELFERGHLDPLVGAFLAFPVFFGIGRLVYWLFVRWLPVSNQPTLGSLLLMFGIWLVLQNLAYLVWGNEDRSIFTPRTFLTTQIGPITISTLRLVAFAVALVSLVVFALVLRRTWYGRSVRALIQSRYAGQLVGVDTRRTASLTFGLGIGFAGMAGALLASLYSFNPDFGRPFLIRSFVIIVLGGLESASGVALGALVLALAETIGILFVPAGYQLAISFGLLVLVLLVLPGGQALDRRGGESAPASIHHLHLDHHRDRLEHSRRIYRAGFLRLCGVLWPGRLHRGDPDQHRYPSVSCFRWLRLGGRFRFADCWSPHLPFAGALLRDRDDRGQRDGSGHHEQLVGDRGRERLSDRRGDRVSSSRSLLHRSVAGQLGVCRFGSDLAEQIWPRIDSNSR